MLIKLALHVISLSLAMALSSCGGESTTPPITPPLVSHAAAITITNGNGQSGIVGATLSEPLVVVVTDSAGKPFSGANVIWTLGTNSGSVDKPTTPTDSTGTASTYWTIGTKAGTHSLTASLGPLRAVFTASGTPGPAAMITIKSPAISLLTEDVAQLTATVSDEYGNAISDALGVAWTSSDPWVAEVSDTGVLAAIHPGQVSISAANEQAAGELSLKIDPKITFSFGAEEIVFHHSTDSCEPLDVPDTSAHAIRLPDGTLTLLDGDAPTAYSMFGADFNSLYRVCVPVLRSDDSWYPETFNNQEWISASYIEGNIIHALVHVEYHDPISSNCAPGNTHPGNPCWYNSITYAYSSDSGRTFTHATPPQHLVAGPAQKWDPVNTPYPPYGYFAPSQIVKREDGYYYSVFRGILPGSGLQTNCVMRTQTLSDPTSWRAWDGTRYGLRMTDPYADPAPMCTPVGPEGFILPEPTLTFNSYLGKYMMVGRSWEPNPPICVFSYSLSSDLIHWTPIQRIRRYYVAWEGCQPPSGEKTEMYPSIIDHDDTTPNFEVAGQKPYLYFTRFQDPYLDRDLVRVPMTITVHQSPLSNARARNKDSVQRKDGTPPH
jgi:Big-like domain-containing protein